MRRQSSLQAAVDPVEEEKSSGLKPALPHALSHMLSLALLR
jgi:hypothetical protein